MPEHALATNAEIDAAILAYVREKSPRGMVESLSIGANLDRLFHGRLTTTKNTAGKDLWIGGEHANRGCQRLRKKGLLKFTPKGGWTS